MPTTKKLVDMTPEELNAEEARLIKDQQAVMKARAKDEADYKAKQGEIQAVLDRIAAIRRFGGLSDAERKLLVEMGG